MNVRRIIQVLILILCAFFVYSTTNTTSSTNRQVVNLSDANHGLAFIGNPSLFQPISVKYTNPRVVNFSRLAYLDLESRPLDVLPGREHHDWRVIVTRSAPFGVQVEFGCEWLTATGLYRIRARSGNKTLTTPTVQLSNARRQDAPRLLLREDSIFPHCQHDFDLSWQLPNCTLERRAAADTFRIRVSAVQADGMELYMGELRPTAELPSSVGIPCAQFDIIYVEFCFELVSLQPYTHQLDLWDRKCINTEPVLKIDGGWSVWSSWSECSKLCGGGRRKRKRECTNPKPQRGRYCVGRMVESEGCNREKCQKVPEPLSTPHSSNLPVHRLGCECGCMLSESGGAIFVGSSSLNSAKCPKNRTTIEWHVPSRYLARLRIAFVGQLDKEEKLRVLDDSGHEMYSLNGLHSNPTSAMFPLDTDLTIEFKPHENRAGDGSGLILDYEIIPAPQPSADGSEYSALIGSRFVDCRSKKCHAVMTILSLLVCLVTIMILVAVPPLICSFITRRRMRSRKREAKRLLESMRGESEMMRSGGTDCTQLSSSNNSATKPPVPPATTNGTVHHESSTQKFVSKRSIGVQQSAQTTPRQLRSALETPKPNASIASVDLEYDYYDPIVPGSLLRPGNGTCGYDEDIDIEGIIASETSGWLADPPPHIKEREI